MKTCEFIQMRRKELGLTQKEFAEKAGVSLSVVKRFETDAPYDPSGATLRKVTRGLDLKGPFLYSPDMRMEYQIAKEWLGKNFRYLGYDCFLAVKNNEIQEEAESDLLTAYARTTRVLLKHGVDVLYFLNILEEEYVELLEILEHHYELVS